MSCSTITKDEKETKKVLLILDWTLWKAAYVPLFEDQVERSSVIEFEQEILLPLRVHLVIECKT